MLNATRNLMRFTSCMKQSDRGISWNTNLYT